MARDETMTKEGQIEDILGTRNAVDTGRFTLLFLFRLYVCPF